MPWDVGVLRLRQASRFALGLAALRMTRVVELGLGGAVGV
jgi:hypothetical protein